MPDLSKKLLKEINVQIQEEAYSAWLYKLKPSNVADLSELLDSTEYQKVLESEIH